MKAPDTIVEVVLWLMGGLALFIYGMRTMSTGLSAAVGEGVRGIIAQATRNRMAGTALGSIIGFLIQSSASIVLFIGFINAGLMTFGKSVALMLGANIGTTLSIQLISFKLSDYCLVLVFLGLILNLIAKTPKVKFGGLALLGFGILFLGMTIMGDAIRPHRAAFEPWLAHINGSTPSGLLSGMLIAALVTGVIQSSGAVIGMGFAMVSAGAITDFTGIYPIIIGANIGTCVTGLLSSIGTTIDARRIAVAHLIFNLISTALAIAAAPLFYRFIPLTSGDIIHQAANANTIKMVLSALLFLPVVPFYGKLIHFITPSRKKQPEPSFLTPELVNRPEQAIFCCLCELRRTARICAESLRLAAQEFVQHDQHNVNKIAVNEQSINAIKAAMRDYLPKLTHHYLSRRQAVLIEHIDRCMSDLERVSDHIERLSETAQRQRSMPAARFDKEAYDDWFAVHRAVARLLAKMIDSLDPTKGSFQETAKDVLALGEEYRKTVLAAQESHLQRLDSKTVTPISGMIFNDYLSHFWRIARHIKSIAVAEQQPQFRVKREKLDQVMTNDAPGYAMPDEIDLDDYLETLQSDD